MKKRFEFKFWDYVVLFGALLILGWALLKSFSVINSPMWSNMIPFFGVSIVGAIYKFSKFENQMIFEVKSLRKDVDRILDVDIRLVKLESEHNVCCSGFDH